MSFSSRFSRNHPQRTAKRILPRMLMFWICLPARALRPALFTGGHRIRMRIPAPRGHGGHGGAGRAGRHVGGTSACVLRDEDLQLSLLCRYELHHSGLDTVPDSLKWHQGLVGLRLDREAAFEAARRHTGHRPLPQPLPSPPTPPRQKWWQRSCSGWLPTTTAPAPPAALSPRRPWNSCRSS